LFADEGPGCASLEPEASRSGSRCERRRASVVVDIESTAGRPPPGFDYRRWRVPDGKGQRSTATFGKRWCGPRMAIRTSSAALTHSNDDGRRRRCRHRGRRCRRIVEFTVDAGCLAITRRFGPFRFRRRSSAAVLFGIGVRNPRFATLRLLRDACCPAQAPTTRRTGGWLIFWALERDAIAGWCDAWMAAELLSILRDGGDDDGDLGSTA